MAAPYKPYDHVGGVTNVSGSSGVFAATGTLGTYRPWTVVTDGDVVPYDRFDASGNFENGLARVNQSGGVATLTRVIFGQSSTGTAITWAPGATQNLICAHHSAVAAILQNNGADFPDPVAFAANIGAARRVASGLSGGSNSTICRMNGAGAVVSASNTDTFSSLWPIYWRGPDGLLYRPGEVPGTFAAAQKYWLGTGGALLTAPPTVSATVFGLFVGVGLTTGLMDFRPSPPWRLA